jgi:pimeloyl-ACP methyl ester carboxylesterase
MLNSVVSRDGTVIGFESLGEGPPLVFVHGATADRTRWAPIRERFTGRFTVHTVDRRGRGLSTDEAETYSLRSEGEDVAAVVEAVGGGVHLVGHSYGALCSLEAALLTDAIGRLTLYEPPMQTPGYDVISPEGFEALKAATEPEVVLETFFRETLGLSQTALDAMKGTPIWRARVAAAHTVVREVAEVRRFEPTDRLAKITVGVRLLLGTESTAYLHAVTKALAARIDGATIVDLHGQAHQAMDFDPDQFVAAVLGE